MPPTLADVAHAAHRLWPLSGTEPWDAAGLVAGDPDDEVRRILLAVDAVAATVDEAIGADADLLLVHHPLLLRGVTTVAADRYKGALLTRLIRSSTALLAAHTNADVVASGTSAVLAERLGLRDIRPLVPGADEMQGLGRIGRLDAPTTLGRLAREIASVLPATAQGVRVAGGYEQPVQTVALCAGAGDSLLAHPLVVEADVYVTADLRHHPASEAREQAVLAGRPALIDVAHWASEWLWLDRAADELRTALPGVEVAVSETNTDPWDFVVLQ